MNNLQFINEWDKLLAKIAEVMNVSVEAIQLNAGEYLLKFARYQLISDIGRCFAGGMLLGIIFTIIKMIVTDGEKLNQINLMKVFVISTVIGFTFVFGSEVLKYLVSPEIYGIKELMRLMK